MKNTFCVLACFFITIFCQAQSVEEHYYFKNLSIRNGLSQNTVNAILQDRKGFMWLGTKDGLNRYDGLSFRKFKHDAANPRSIGNSFITSLYEDFNGNIWVGTDAGVYIYYPEKEAFEEFDCQSLEKTRIERSVSMIAGDKQGRVGAAYGRIVPFVRLCGWPFCQLCRFRERESSRYSGKGRSCVYEQQEDL